MGDVTIARAIHVLSIVHWIAGLAFVTLVVLPLCRRSGIALFEQVERCFAAQVRVSVPLAGASGLYMAERLVLWSRLLDPTAWWLGAMLLLWLLFMAMPVTSCAIAGIAAPRVQGRSKGPSPQKFHVNPPLVSSIVDMSRLIDIIEGRVTAEQV